MSDPVPPKQPPRSSGEPRDQRIAVPGDSPAYFVGDSSDDILAISQLDLIPNHPLT